MNTRLLRSLLAAALLTGATAAQAGGTANVLANDGQGGNMTLALEFLDAANLRLSSPQIPQGYALLAQGQVYSVVQMGPIPVVIEASKMLQTFGVDLQSYLPAGADDIRRFISLTPTGKSETVAGLPGVVHRLRYVDGSGTEREDDLVLTPDANIRDLTHTLYRLSAALAAGAGVAAPEGSDKLMQQLDARGLGLLRFGDRLRIAQLDRASPSPDRFVLPADPLSTFSSGFGLGQ